MIGISGDGCVVRVGDLVFIRDYVDREKGRVKLTVTEIEHVGDWTYVTGQEPGAPDESFITSPSGDVFLDPCDVSID